MKTFTVIYSSASLDDLRSIYTYIADDLLAPQATGNTVNRFRTDIKKIRHFPEKHRLAEWEP